MENEVITRIVQDLRLNAKARLWCTLQYPGHPRGCTNYNKKYTCPPAAPFIQDYLDVQRPITLIAIKFDLAGHIKWMRVRNPSWSDRQVRCVLYWQAGVNKQLRQEACRFIYHADGSRDMVYTTCPEAMGVNVIATAQRCDIPVQVQPKDTVYKIALVGYAPGVTPVRRAN
jgi:predicted metal-binding protein